jgi:hypothetical protein
MWIQAAIECGSGSKTLAAKYVLLYLSGAGELERFDELVQLL